jgi:hypothetical protein
VCCAHSTESRSASDGTHNSEPGRPRITAVPARHRHVPRRRSSIRRARCA